MFIVVFLTILAHVHGSTVECSCDSAVAPHSWVPLRHGAADCELRFAVVQQLALADWPAFTAQQPNASEFVFIARQGENEGMVLRGGGSVEEAISAGAAHLAVAEGVTHVWTANACASPAPSFDATTLVNCPSLSHVLFVGLPTETWVWPAVSVGYQRAVGSTVLTSLSVSPRVLLADAALSAAQCVALRTAADSAFAPSPERHYSPGFENYRTSQTAAVGDTAAGAEARAIAQSLARLPTLEYVEPLQVVRYTQGKWYKEHQDTFHHPNAQSVALASALSCWTIASTGHLAYGSPWQTREQLEAAVLLELRRQAETADSHNVLRQVLPAASAGGSLPIAHLVTLPQRQLPVDVATDALARLNPSLADHLDRRSCPDPHGSPLIIPNRHVTVFFYLNDDFEGGETIFPAAPGTGSDIPRPGMPECSRGLAVQPSLGAAAIFYSQTPSGQKDPLSAHGGCPPLRETDVKYGSNGFSWNVPATHGYNTWQPTWQE